MTTSVSMRAEEARTPAVAPPFDTDLLRERMQGDVELIRELQELFREDARELAEELAAAGESDRTKVAVRVGHALRGAAANVGADGFRALGLALETASPGAILPLLAELRDRISELDRFLAG